MRSCLDAGTDHDSQPIASIFRSLGAYYSFRVGIQEGTTLLRSNMCLFTSSATIERYQKDGMLACNSC